MKVFGKLLYEFEERAKGWSAPERAQNLATLERLAEKTERNVGTPADLGNEAHALTVLKDQIEIVKRITEEQSREVSKQ